MACSPLVSAATASRPRGRDARRLPSEGGGLAPLTYTKEFSTWNGADFLHMDCLYVEDGHRGHRLGAVLMRLLSEHAQHSGIGQLQWQTPTWNTDAVRFYDRSGARRADKIRYTLTI